MSISNMTDSDLAIILLKRVRVFLRDNKESFAEELHLSSEYNNSRYHDELERISKYREVESLLEQVVLKLL